MTEKRKKAIRKRRLFLSLCVVVIIAAIAVLCFIVSSIAKSIMKSKVEEPSPKPQSTVSENISSVPAEKKEPEMVTRGDYTLDADYSRLLLVNGEYPLPDDYNYGWNLTTIESKYHNGQLDKIDADKHD